MHVSDKMLSAFLVLLACELAGDLLRQALALPVPGPVIGMTILAAALVFKRKTPTSNSPVIVSLEQTSEALIRHMGLLFVPAGVGLIAEMQVLLSRIMARLYRRVISPSGLERRRHRALAGQCEFVLVTGLTLVRSLRAGEIVDDR